MVDLGQQVTERREVRPAAPRVVVVVSQQARAGPYRVEAHDRVLRMFGVLTSARDELDLAALTPAGRARVRSLLNVVRAELERSVSPALVGELNNLVRRAEPEPSAGALRVEYASLLGWASGLVVAMLDQFGNDSDKPHLLTPGPEAP